MPAIEDFRNLEVSFTLASHLVGEEPGEEWVRMARDERLFAEVPYGAEDEAVARGATLMDGWLAAVTDEDLAERLGDIQRDHLRLIVGVGEPLAPAWESYHTTPNALYMSEATLDVRKYYKAYGLEVVEGVYEQSDSLRLMLQFCGIAWGMAADAAESDGEEAGARVAHRLRDIEDIVVKHTLPWISTWRYLMDKHAKTDYFRGVGEYVFGLLRATGRLFGVAYDEESQRFNYTHEAAEEAVAHDGAVSPEVAKKLDDLKKAAALIDHEKMAAQAKAMIAQYGGKGVSIIR